jgi:hypothetical protein
VPARAAELDLLSLRCPRLRCLVLLKLPIDDEECLSKLVLWWLHLELEAKPIPRPHRAAGPTLPDGEVASGEREGGSRTELEVVRENGCDGVITYLWVSSLFGCILSHGFASPVGRCFYDAQ